MERTQKWTVVLDLDGSLETPYFRKDDSAKVREWMLNHPCGYAFERLYAEALEQRYLAVERQVVGKLS